MRDLLADFDALRDHPLEMARINRHFHESIVSAARNRYLWMMLEELQDGIGLLGTTTFSVADRPASAAVEHRAIVEALASHDATEAAALAAVHIREALRFRLRLFQRNQEVRRVRRQA